MRNKILILVVIIVGVTQICFSQSKKSKDQQAFTNKKSVSYSDDEQLKIIIKSLMLYNKTFKYNDEIKNGNYKIATVNNGYSLNILKDSSIIDNIEISRKQIKNGDVVLILDSEKIKRLLVNDIATSPINHTCSDVFTLINTNYMLWDKEVLNTNAYQFGKIFDRQIALDNFVDQDNNQCPIFWNLQDGVIIPYNQGNTSKVLCVDRSLNSIVFIDKATNNLNVQYYGSFGNGNNQLISPTGITYGREINYGSYSIFPIYIADLINQRIVSVNYRADSQDGVSGFDQHTFGLPPIL